MVCCRPSFFDFVTTKSVCTRLSGAGLTVGNSRAGTKKAPAYIQW